MSPDQITPWHSLLGIKEHGKGKEKRGNFEDKLEKQSVYGERTLIFEF